MRRASFSAVALALVGLSMAWFARYSITPTSTTLMFIRHDRWTNEVELCRFEKSGHMTCLSGNRDTTSLAPPRKTAAQIKEELERMGY